MDYEAYLDAFQAELNYKPKAPAFGHPPAAGGIGSARKASRPNSEIAPLSDEKKEAISKAKGAAKKDLQDLHADGLNIKTMTQDDRIKMITEGLKSFVENDKIAKEINNMFQDPRFKMEDAIKHDPLKIAHYLTVGNAKNAAKFAFLAAASCVVADRNILVSIVKTIKG